MALRHRIRFRGQISAGTEPIRNRPRPMDVHPPVMSRAQLLAFGRDDAAIRRAVADGTLIRLRPGWFARPDADAATMEAVRRGGVLSCVSALRMHGLWIPPGHGDVHVRYSRHGSATARGRRCHGQGRALPLTTAVDAVPVALDCATRCLARDEWIVVCDSALEKSKWSTRRMQSEMPACLERTREWMTHCDGRSQSGTETLVRLRLRALGYDVEVQPKIDGVGRVDLRVGKLLIECDSIEHHTGVENYSRDRRRDRRALVAGWLKLRLTYDDVMNDWDEALADIRAITRAGRHRVRR